MNWIDAHCHLTDPRVGDVAAVVESCRQAGITRFVSGGIEPSEWDRQLELARRYPQGIVRVFGLHPWWVHEQVEKNTAKADQAISDALSALESRLGECAALGEAGLDAARDRFKLSKAEQVGAFEAQLELAARRSKPVVLHIVRAHALALETLERRGPLGGLVHSFSGTWADACRYLDLGLTLSVSARVTYPDARDLRETVLKAPLDRLVFETDAPDQPPYGSSERVHAPLSLLKVVQEVSRIRGEKPEALLDRSRENLKALFRV